MNKPKQCIIWGGGYSIKEGLEKGLISKLKNKFVIGTNFSFHTFPDATLLSYVDKDFYDGTMKSHYEGDKIVANLNEKGKKHVKKLKSLPLIIGTKHGKLEPYPNTITLSNSNSYKRDIRKGCYKSSLVGIFALSLGIYLLDEGEIFMLGMDYGCPNSEKDKNGKFLTHYYQEQIDHRGIGKVSHYNTKDRAKRDYEVYRNEQKCKIYNVSLSSKIPENIFPKISYDTFFKMLDNKYFNQDILRQEIKEKLI